MPGEASEKQRMRGMRETCGRHEECRKEVGMHSEMQVDADGAGTHV